MIQKKFFWGTLVAIFIIVFILGRSKMNLIISNNYSQASTFTPQTDRFDENMQSLSEEQQEEIQKLEAIGYMSGTQTAPSLNGVTIFDENKAYRGLNLYTSGHACQAILMDMKGNILHKWQYDYFKVWPDRDTPLETYGHQNWRFVYLYENGDLLAIQEGQGLIKLDKDSNLLWASPERIHHDLHVMENGDIYALARVAHILPRINPQKPILEDFVVVLDSNGNIKRRISLLEALERSVYATILDMASSKEGDLFHTNTLNWLDGSLASQNHLFKRGNFLICFKKLDLLAILDMETEQIVWCSYGPWVGQHQPFLLDNGNILLFNNNRGFSFSEIIEWNPATKRTEWYYLGNPPESLFTESCGAVQPLPNGNVLAVITEQGRVIEITKNKEVVWEFINPHRLEENRNTIASIFELTRLRPDFSIDWLSK